LAFDDEYPMPRALSIDGIKSIVSAFAAAARRACEAGFRVIEIHAAHGYVIHEFLSPLSNQRRDAYGGSFENRTRVLREIVSTVRGSWPEGAPLFVRISATDWIEGAWDVQQSVELARQLKELGADLIDCSSGGNIPHAEIAVGPGYQTSFAEQIRRETSANISATSSLSLNIARIHPVDHVFCSNALFLGALAKQSRYECEEQCASDQKFHNQNSKTNDDIGSGSDDVLMYAQRAVSLQAFPSGRIADTNAYSESCPAAPQMELRR
jgi:2,4-dienoyl-CoA reductase-like NADH-dependent reductase (Old Yellow Enzyme family)